MHQIDREANLVSSEEYVEMLQGHGFGAHFIV